MTNTESFAIGSLANTENILIRSHQTAQTAHCALCVAHVDSSEENVILLNCHTFIGCSVTPLCCNIAILFNFILC